MSTNLAEFSEKFRLADLTILRMEHWTWSVRPVHSTLGSSILSLNRFCARFGDITTEEASEIGSAAREIERRLGGTFKPEKINYLMLMMVDAHLHFHVIPRYSSPREFGDVRWVDAGWPAFPSLGDGADYQKDTILKQICEVLTTTSL
jgi:diadenosine tetraphosphate (Ap4A) HIT family hydrolase